MKLNKCCYICKKSFSSPTLAGLGEFFGKWKNSSAEDGLLGRCKPCNRALSAEYRKNNRDKEVSRVRRFQKGKDGEMERERVRRLTRGLLGSAKMQKCNECGNGADHWHHHTYSASGAVDLCWFCHAKEHAK